MADLTALSRALDIRFGDRSLLEQALVHSSYVNENPAIAAVSNERLEFLGDAVLGFIVAEKLYRDFPALGEGEMTRRRAALVRRETLADLARKVRLGDYLYLGKGEEASGGRGKPSNLAGALEAVIGAVFLDRGLETARRVVLRLLDVAAAGEEGKGGTPDYKSELQEIVQSQYRVPPSYRLVDAAGPPHARTFTVTVSAGEDVLGRGSGKSKKLAEADAARAALARFTP